jgi:hypothetical protein
MRSLVAMFLLTVAARAEFVQVDQKIFGMD